MQYILIGKRAANLSYFKEKLSERFPYDRFVICRNIRTFKRPPRSKLIYIKVSIPVSWDWEFSGQLDVHSSNAEFIDELMDFKKFDSKQAEIVVNFDGCQLTSTLAEIERKVGEFSFAETDSWD